jgi:hypothetical protein
MENFKEIAEKCLSGELSGTFVTAFGNNWHSSYLQRHAILGHEMPAQYVLGPGVIYNELGQCESREKVRIIDFIPDNMQEQIKIDIPEGKVPVMEQTANGIVITWKEKELTYDDVCKELQKYHNIIGNPTDNPLSDAFHKKAWTIRKLINIRNYFGQPDKHIGWCIIYRIADNCIVVTEEHKKNPYRVVFKEKEHAEQAIKMLGDELKCLFEPW